MSTSTPTTHDILTSARELANAIAATAAYREFEQASDAFLSNKEAQKLLRDLQRAQQEAQMASGWGNSVDDSGLDALRNRVTEHPLLSRYFRSQEDLVGELKELDQFMTERLGFDFAELTKPAGGCC